VALGDSSATPIWHGSGLATFKGQTLILFYFFDSREWLNHFPQKEKKKKKKEKKKKKCLGLGVGSGYGVIRPPTYQPIWGGLTHP
jgi:hypothetical protein